MQKSILDAIREGSWDYEPKEVSGNHYHATSALPGSAEKLEILADRAEQGLPLWHDSDCRDYEDRAQAAELGGLDGRNNTRLVSARSPRD